MDFISIIEDVIDEEDADDASQEFYQFKQNYNDFNLSKDNFQNGDSFQDGGDFKHGDYLPDSVPEKSTKQVHWRNADSLISASSSGSMIYSFDSNFLLNQEKNI